MATVYNLPSTYQQVEYIGTDGGQYIDTGIASNNNNSFEMSIRECSGSNGYILSQGNNSLRTGGTNYIRWFTRNCNIAGGFTSGEENKVEFGYNYLIINGVDGTKTTDSDSAAGNIRLFCRNTDTVTGAIVKIGYCKIWDSSSNLVGLFVACYRKSDGVIGMYNTVNSTFYTNNGSGNFTKGDDVKKGTIINMVYLNREEKLPGWDIDNNTISYLRLRGNLKDEVGDYTWTSGSNLTYDSTLADFPVAYMTYNNGYAYTTTNGPTISGSNSYTISGWVKQTSATGSMCIFNSGSDGSGGTYYKGMKFYKFYESGNYKGYFVMYLGGYSGTQGFEIGYNYNPGTNWHLWTVTYTPGAAKIYLDGSIVSTTSTTLSGTVTPENPMTIGVVKADGWKNPTAYYSDIIFDGKVRTAEEISTYYHNMKGYYGL